MPNTLRQILVGKPKDPTDPKVFHHVSLIAFLAWVGLGADGLSSSSYGPEEAFKALGEHVYLAGGANSAGQAAVNLARYARQVTVVVRGESLAARMRST